MVNCLLRNFVFACIIILCMNMPALAQNAKCTFLIYLDADNNLEEDGINDFNEIARDMTLG